MIRTQVHLTEQQLAKLRRMSSASGKSVAELVRNGVDDFLAGSCLPGLRTASGGSLQEMTVFADTLALYSLLEVDWITAERHAAAAHALLTAGRRKLSLVDCASFESMRQLGVDVVFAFDRHFREQGFKLAS